MELHPQTENRVGRRQRWGSVSGQLQPHFNKQAGLNDRRNKRSMMKGGRVRRRSVPDVWQMQFCSSGLFLITQELLNREARHHERGDLTEGVYGSTLQFDDCQQKKIH